MTRPSTPRATGYVVVAALCFAAIAIFVTLGTRSGASLPAVLAVRYLGAMAMLLLVARREARIPWGRRMRLVALGGGGQAVIAVLSLSSLRWIPAATLSFLFYTFPAWVMLFAVVRGKERATAPRVMALGAALAGIAVMVGLPGAGAIAAGAAPGVALALASAVLYALYIPLIGALGEGIQPAAAAGYIGMGAGIIFAAWETWAGGGGAWRLTSEGLVYGLALALICTATAFILFLKGLAVLGPVRTAITSTVEPFFTALLGALVLAQPLSARTLAGGALVALAVWLLHRPATDSRHFTPEGA